MAETARPAGVIRTPTMQAEDMLDGNARGSARLLQPASAVVDDNAVKRHDSIILGLSLLIVVLSFVTVAVLAYHVFTQQHQYSHTTLHHTPPLHEQHHNHYAHSNQPTTTATTSTPLTTSSPTPVTPATTTTVKPVSSVVSGSHNASSNHTSQVPIIATTTVVNITHVHGRAHKKGGNHALHQQTTHHENYDHHEHIEVHEHDAHDEKHCEGEHEEAYEHEEVVNVAPHKKLYSCKPEEQRGRHEEHRHHHKHHFGHHNHHHHHALATCFNGTTDKTNVSAIFYGHIDAHSVPVADEHHHRFLENIFNETLRNITAHNHQHEEHLHEYHHRHHKHHGHHGKHHATKLNNTLLSNSSQLNNATVNANKTDGYHHHHHGHHLSLYELVHEHHHLHSHRLGLTPFAHLTHKQFVKSYLLNKDGSTLLEQLYIHLPIYNQTLTEIRLIALLNTTGHSFYDDEHDQVALSPFMNNQTSPAARTLLWENDDDDDEEYDDKNDPKANACARIEDPTLSEHDRISLVHDCLGAVLKKNKTQNYTQTDAPHNTSIAANAAHSIPPAVNDTHSVVAVHVTAGEHEHGKDHSEHHRHRHSAFDWSEHGFVGRPKAHGHCGANPLFSALSVIESAAHVHAVHTFLRQEFLEKKGKYEEDNAKHHKTNTTTSPNTTTHNATAATPANSTHNETHHHLHHHHHVHTLEDEHYFRKHHVGHLLDHHGEHPHEFIKYSAQHLMDCVFHEEELCKPSMNNNALALLHHFSEQKTIFVEELDYPFASSSGVAPFTCTTHHHHTRAPRLHHEHREHHAHHAQKNVTGVQNQTVHNATGKRHHHHHHHRLHHGQHVNSSNSTGVCSEDHPHHHLHHRHHVQHHHAHRQPHAIAVDQVYRVNASDVEKVLRRNGPLLVCVDGHDHAFQHYKSGVYTPSHCHNDRPSICLLLVGVGNHTDHHHHHHHHHHNTTNTPNTSNATTSSNGTISSNVTQIVSKYWILQSSFGSHWGINGYIHWNMSDKLCSPANHAALVTIRHVPHEELKRARELEKHEWEEHEHHTHELHESVHHQHDEHLLHKSESKQEHKHHHQREEEEDGDEQYEELLAELEELEEEVEEQSSRRHHRHHGRHLSGVIDEEIEDVLQEDSGDEMLWDETDYINNVNADYSDDDLE